MSTGNDFFTVQPVRHYAGAQYPSAYAHDPEDDRLEKEVHPLAILLALVMAVAMTLFASGCYLNTHHTPETPQPDGGTGDGGPDPDCDDDDLRCDGSNLQVCHDESWVSQSCHDYCRETFGPDYYSEGCDAEADDPCQCEYGMIDGMMAECDEGEVLCFDDNTMGVCEDGWDYTMYNCDELCNERYAEEPMGYGYSMGCDASAEDPCQCQYDILEGDAPYCGPDEIRCFDDDTLIVCTDYDVWDEIDCEDRCDELYGVDSTSTGCDATQEEPCLCVIMDSGSGGE